MLAADINALLLLRTRENSWLQPRVKNRGGREHSEQSRRKTGGKAWQKTKYPRGTKKSHSEERTCKKQERVSNRVGNTAGIETDRSDDFLADVARLGHFARHDVLCETASGERLSSKRDGKRWTVAT